MSLPRGYTRLEYIESDGRQWINTGFEPNQDTRVVMEFEILAAAMVFMFGVRKTTSAGQFAFYWDNQGNFRSRYNTSNIASAGTMSGRHTVDMNKNVCTIDGKTTTHTYAAFQTAYPLYLFTCNTTGSVYSTHLTGRVYSCRMYDNGTIVRDFVPCRSSLGEIGLYDDANGVFYQNSGTGTFAAGADVITGPTVPEYFTAESGVGSVSLAWGESDDADGYRIYRNGVLIADVAAASYTDEDVEKHSGVRYMLVPYNASGEGGGISAAVIVKGDARPISDLITDRTAADVTMKTRKGAYNASDLNRVTAAAEYVHALLVNLGYDAADQTGQRWFVNDIPTRNEMTAHHNAVIGLDVIGYAHKKIALPTTAAKLNYEGANNIEKFLLLCGEAAERIPEAYVYSDEITGGEFL